MGHLEADCFSATDLCFLRTGSECESERANSAWPELRRWVMTFSERAENERRPLRTVGAETEAARAERRLRPAR